MTGNLFTLLRRRMAAEGVEADDPVAVAELHKRLLPYHTCREELGFATKAEYDVAMLELLADADLLSVAEPALREAVRSEIRGPEPGLGFLQRFAASEVRLTGTVPGPGGVALPKEHDRGADVEDVPPRVAFPGGPAVSASADSASPAPTLPDAPADAGRPTCRRCQAKLPPLEGVRFCPNCGADQVVPTCEDCGSEIEEGWKYCAFCGRLQE